MFNARLIAALGSMSVLAAGALAQQPGKDTKIVAQGNGEALCKKNVRDYVEAIKFVRQSAGHEVGERVAVGLITEAELSRVAETRGPCAASGLLRAKGLLR